MYLFESILQGPFSLFLSNIKEQTNEKEKKKEKQTHYLNVQNKNVAVY